MRLVLPLLWQHMKKMPRLWAGLAVLTTLMAALWVIEPLYSSYAVDALLTLADGKQVNFVQIFGWWGAVFFALSLVQGVEKYFQWKMVIDVELSFVQRLYRHALHLPMAFHVQQKAGEAMKVIDEGGSELSYVARILIDLFPSVLSSLAFLIISLFIEPLLAGVLMGTLLLYCIIIIVGTIKTEKLQDRANRAWVRPTGRAFDVFTNIFTVKSAARELSELERMQTGHRTVLKWQLKVNKRWAIIEAMHFFMLTRILLVGIGILLYVHGSLTLGELYFFQFSFFRVLVPFEILANVLPDWNKNVGKIKLAHSLFAIAQEKGIRKAGIVPKTLRGEIEFQRVSFAYDHKTHTLKTEEEDATPDILPEAESLLNDNVSLHTPPEEKREPGRASSESSQQLEPISVLRDVDLHVLPGEHIALVGHSGAGKSTIAMLLNRFYDPTQGSILVDGLDLKKLDLRWWRSQIGLVLQDNLMFNDSLLDNIRYARPNATEEEIRTAARRASAEEFIAKLPHKYRTLVGERGIRLSGGERQRIAIARAILKNPSIVILDEATSALDSLTEKKVQEGIQELIKGRTSFIIAHRLSTVRSVDRIAIVEGGAITACAPHDILMQQSETYRSMIALQRGGVLAE